MTRPLQNLECECGKNIFASNDFLDLANGIVGCGICKKEIGVFKENPPDGIDKCLNGHWVHKRCLLGERILR